MRFLHRLYAFFFGYFWLPCPVCGKYFGGHEIHPGFGKAVLSKPGLFKSTCSVECSLKIVNHNKKVVEEWLRRAGCSDDSYKAVVLGSIPR